MLEFSVSAIIAGLREVARTIGQVIIEEHKKRAGKKTIGIYHQPTCSQELARSFDMRIYFDEKAIKSWLKEK